MARPFKRVVLKITGEAIKGDYHVFDRKALNYLAREIRSVYGKVELAIVIGGGNIARGRWLIRNFQTSPVIADHIGMTATILNALLLEDFLQRGGMETRLMSALEIKEVAEPYIFKRALKHLDRGRVVIIAGGTGVAGVSTDTAAVLRASDIGADMMMKGTKVNGVFDSDPATNPNAVLIPRLTYQEFLAKGLSGILDESAVAQAKMRGIPILVFNIFEKGNLLKAVQGKEIGSLIS